MTKWTVNRSPAVVRNEKCAIVGVEEAKSLHEVAHCIANMYAYGTQQSFYENVEQIKLAISKAKDYLTRTHEH